MRLNKSLATLTSFSSYCYSARLKSQGQGPWKIDKWGGGGGGGGGGHTFIYSCCASLISFEIDCFYSL